MLPEVDVDRMTVLDRRIDKLTSQINNSFRVRPNHDPIYVDVADHIARLAAKQHQVVFGRRGSRKSCLMVHYHRVCARPDNVLSVYIDADEIKSLSLSTFSWVLRSARQLVHKPGRQARLVRIVVPAGASPRPPNASRLIPETPAKLAQPHSGHRQPEARQE